MLKFSIYTLGLSLIISLIFSCSNDTKENMPSDRPAPVASYQLIHSFDYEISIGEKSSYDAQYYQYLEDKGNEYLMIYNKRTSEIEIYNLTSNSLESVLEIPREGSSAPKFMESFYALNLDSIYAISPKTESMTLYNRHGEKISYYRFNDGNEERVIDTYPSNIYVIYNNWAYRKGSNLYFPCIEQAPVSDLDRYDKSTLAQSFNIQSQAVRYFYQYPKLYSEKNFSHLTTNQFRTMNSDYLFVYGFSADDYIHVTDYKEMNDRHFGGTVLFDPPFEMPQNERNSQSDLYQQYRMLSPLYRGILYDKYREVYYRFFVSEGNKKSPLHQMRYYAEISVIMLDKEFNWIGETKLPKNTYSYKFWFVGKDGLYVSKSHPFNESISEDKIKFGVFLPEKI